MSKVIKTIVCGQCNCLHGCAKDELAIDQLTFIKTKMENQEKLTMLDKVQEIIKLAYEYQNKGIGTANIRLNGHVSNIDIDLHHGGWKYGYSAEKNLSFYIHEYDNGEYNADPVIQEMKDIIANAPEVDRIKKAKELSHKKEKLEKLAKELNVKIVG